MGRVRGWDFRGERKKRAMKRKERENEEEQQKVEKGIKERD